MVSDLAYRPSRPRPASGSSLDVVFAAGGQSRASSVSDEGWAKTSVAMRRATRRRVKLFALEHDMSMQEVVDLALMEYLSGRE